MQRGYAKRKAQEFLLSHAAELQAKVPDTVAARRNLSIINKHNPPDQMDLEDLCSWVDLLARSVPADTTS